MTLSFYGQLIAPLCPVHKNRPKRGRDLGKTQWSTNHVAKNGRLSRWGIVNIPLLTLLVAAACACNKDDSNFTDMPITMSLTEAGSTKALLDATTFETTGNRIKIYDYYSGGSIATGYYIDDVIKCSTPGLWPFEKESYKWTTDGVHNFFGWLVDDVRLNNEYEWLKPDFNKDSKILTIPTTTLGQTTPQFDFMYSDIHKRDLNTNPYFTAVPLEFSHLFTAFKITAVNNSSNDVWLKKVSINGLKNTRGASIDYSGTEPVVSYTPPTGQEDFFYNVSNEGMLMTKGQVYNVSPEDFTIMWPHTRDDFSNAEVVVDYRYKEPSAATPLDGNTTIQLKDVISWKGGQKNNLGLMFKDKEISLTCKVEPWTVVADTIDFNDQITVSNPLTWVPNSVESVNYENGEVVLYTDSYSVAICNFRIDTPAGATWTASLIPIEGYADAFKILDNTKYGAVGVDSEVHIQVTNMAPIAPRHVVLLRITVQTADGRTIVADMMPNQTDESITEYKLIQNLING